MISLVDQRDPRAGLFQRFDTLQPTKATADHDDMGPVILLLDRRLGHDHLSYGMDIGVRIPKDQRGSSRRRHQQRQQHWGRSL